MELGINHIFSIIASFQSFFLSFFILSNKKTRSLSNWILAMILFFFSLLILDTFASSREIMPFLSYWKVVVCFSNISLIIAPLVYLYAQSLVIPNFKFTKKNWLHFVPVFLLTIFFIYYWYPNPKNNLINSETLYNIVKVITLLQNFVYVVIILLKFNTLLSLFKTKSTGCKNEKAYFLNQIIIAFVLFWLIEFSCLIIYCAFNKTNICAYSNSLYYTIGFIMLNILMYVALSYPEIFVMKQKYSNSKLSESKKDFYSKRIIEYMETEKPYFNPEISLGKMAELLDIPSRDLSQVINEYFGKSFIDFINDYRIEECKRQLMNFDTNNHKYIADVYYSVGFNSKSVFNTAFKRNTGTTPSRYLDLKANSN